MPLCSYAAFTNNIHVAARALAFLVQVLTLLPPSTTTNSATAAAAAVSPALSVVHHHPTCSVASRDALTGALLAVASRFILRDEAQRTAAARGGEAPWRAHLVFMQRVRERRSLSFFASVALGAGVAARPALVLLLIPPPSLLCMLPPDPAPLSHHAFLRILSLSLPSPPLQQLHDEMPWLSAARFDHYFPSALQRSATHQVRARMLAAEGEGGG